MQTTIINEEYAYFFKALPSFYNRVNPQMHWQQLESKMFGKNVKQPCLSQNYSIHGDLKYTYSGKKRDSLIMPSQVLFIRSLLRDVAAKYSMNFGEMNFVVANKYRTGKDYMAWHDDNEEGMDKRFPVVSASFGTARTFVWRNKDTNLKQSISITLYDGDVFVMKPGFQEKYEHSIFKDNKVNSERISLTYRTMAHR